MSHEFESGFVVREPAWHGLGTVLENAPTVEEGLKVSGLDWKVSKRPAMVWLNPNGMSGIQTLNDYRITVRDTDEQVLGVVGKDYEVLQNEDAFKWFNFLLENGDATLESAGSLRNGQHIWVLAKLNNKEQALGNDIVEPYLLLSNAHNGKMAVWLNFTPVRVVCMNTLTSALETRYAQAKDKKALKIRHTANIQEQLKFAQEVINVTDRAFKQDMEYFKAFRTQELTADQFNKYLEQTFIVQEAAKLRSYDILANNFEAGIGADLAGKTLWGAYNAVTDFVDYHRGREKNDNRLQGAWFGAGRDLKVRAYEVAKEWTN